MESSPSANPEHPKIEVTNQTAVTPSTGSSAAGLASMFNNAHRPYITGGSFSITTNTTNVNTVNGPSLDALYKRVAPHAILNAGGRADEVRCHPGTREEVIGRIEKWRDAQDSRTPPLFWLSGPAGAGKTAIVQTIAERCNATKVPQANFFFFRTDTSRSSLSPLVATLVHQIILLYPSLRDPVASLLSTNPLVLDTVLEDQLRLLVVTPLQVIWQSAVSYHPPLLLLDGLDECESEDKHRQRQIIDAFDKVLVEHPYLFRLLVASRDESQIRAAFNGISSPLLPLYLDGKFSPENDIRSFVNDEFIRVRKTHPLAHMLDATWPLVRDIEGIVEKSSGQFIYAATVMRFIFSSSASPTLSLAMVQGAEPISVKSPFSHLDAIYTFILSRVENQEALKDILHAQLLINEYNTGVTGSVLVDILKAYNLKYNEAIVQSCLAEITSIAQYTNGNGLLFYHASFPDYLLDQSRSKSYFVDPDVFNFKLQPVLWEACRKLERSKTSPLRITALKGLLRLQQLPPGLLTTLTAKDISAAGTQFGDFGFDLVRYLEHIHSLCICDSDVTSYKRILCRWIRGRPQEYSRYFAPEGKSIGFKWPPCAQRYLAMTYIDDHVETEPAAWIDIALCAETDNDASETAMWLTDLLHRIHTRKYDNNVQGYKQLLKKWITWAAWNDILLDGMDDLPKARWYLQRSRMERWAATNLKLGSRPK
ncbi:hypothetical protein D9619_012441 [Psilocybe cf. subviscida]|uniref:NACHT domain-containing protein n=1 Tax=Psilocybe cf. subviscida TaxID=2480587 RepID=A0A8H5AR97_9AGAR|nr:hypothetical protein D9619_012441 [Psilocybe cf. subviscida]